MGAGRRRRLSQGPILALGITDAFRDAELLAEAVDAGFSGTRPIEDALAGSRKRMDGLQEGRSEMVWYEVVAEARGVGTASVGPPQ
jgi:hypothetical protein